MVVENSRGYLSAVSPTRRSTSQPPAPLWSFHRGPHRAGLQVVGRHRPLLHYHRPHRVIRHSQVFGEREEFATAFVLPARGFAG